MCVYMYACMHARMNACMHVCMSVRISIYQRTILGFDVAPRENHWNFMLDPSNTEWHKRMYVCMYVCYFQGGSPACPTVAHSTCKYKCMYVYMYACMNVCMYASMYECTYIYASV